MGGIFLMHRDCSMSSSGLFRGYQEITAHSTLLSMACIASLCCNDRTVTGNIYQSSFEREIPPDLSEFMGTLQTVRADSSSLHSEGERTVCPICLAAWEQEEIIKATPCSHYFH